MRQFSDTLTLTHQSSVELRRQAYLQSSKSRQGAPCLERTSISLSSWIRASATRISASLFHCSVPRQSISLFLLPGKWTLRCCWLNSHPMHFFSNLTDTFSSEPNCSMEQSRSVRHSRRKAFLIVYNSWGHMKRQESMMR